MRAIYKALKNSNVSEYVKARVLNNTIDYILENGVSELLKQLSEPLDTNDLVLWQDGTLELSTSSKFYQTHDEAMFKNSVSGREDIKGIHRNSRFYKENKEVLQTIGKRVSELAMPIRKEIGKGYFGSIYDGISVKSNVEKYYYFNNNAYIAIKDISKIPEGTLEHLELMQLSEFYLLYEKELDNYQSVRNEY